MDNPSALLKQEFLKKWIKGLEIYTNSKKNNNMSILERKKAINLSADVAIALTRNPTTHWSRATLARHVFTGDGASEILVEQLLGRKLEKKAVFTCSNKILRRCRAKARRVVPPSHVKASSIAKKLVKNKTRVLKSLVPGGHQMDGIFLIKETLDYIRSLRVQVDVMRSLVDAAGPLDNPPQRSL